MRSWNKPVESSFLDFVVGYPEAHEGRVWTFWLDHKIRPLRVYRREGNGLNPAERGALGLLSSAIFAIPSKKLFSPAGGVGP